jgi:hypothetical protein
MPNAGATVPMPRTDLAEAGYMKSVQAILVLGALLFLAAASIHGGVAGEAYRHREARIAESVIGAVLLAGWIVGLAKPRSARTVSIGVLGFGLVGTLIGVFTIAIGVGPRTALDLTIHAAMLLLLVTGLVSAVRASRAA